MFPFFLQSLFCFILSQQNVRVNFFNTVEVKYRMANTWKTIGWKGNLGPYVLKYHL